MQPPTPCFLIQRCRKRTNSSAIRAVAETAQNRAQAEQFSFDVDTPRLVEVSNESYDNHTDHQYTVSIDDVTEELMMCHICSSDSSGIIRIRSWMFVTVLPVSVVIFGNMSILVL